MLNIVLFGPPGAGKGTQSKKIIEKFKLAHISTGEVLRRNIEEGTPLGIEAKKLIDDGNYVPDDMAIEIIHNEIARYENQNGFIFDGFPRTTYQAEQFPEILSKHGSNVNLVISIEVDEEVLVERLLNRSMESGRPDDRQEGIIRKRIGIYHQKTSCIKDFYKSVGKLATINGNGEIDAIFDEICSVIAKYN